ncbi:MAG TPA: glycoside hydrolase family 3 C-terminal domain-containing protein, partial [Flavisolibacter sp.]
SREAAVKSFVLLKNAGSVLPLNASAKIAFVGPMVQNQRDLIGNWSGAGDWRKAVSLWSALEQKYGAGKFLYAKGCNLLDDTLLIAKLNPHDARIERDSRSPQQLIDEAVSVARQSDVVVVVLGESFGMSGEAASRSDIGLPENQRTLLRALKETGKPIVLVLMNGRPLTLSWEDQNMDAILETWFAGTMAGHAITDVLFGESAPSGKLTMTFPRNVGQIPIYYNHKNTGRPFDHNQKYTTKYLDVPNTPLYAFGHGLTYTTFSYGDIRVSQETLRPGQSLTAQVTVTNTGTRAGTETVQLYIRDVVGSITRPVKELKGFRQVLLQPGESKTITFRITENDLKFYNSDLKYVSEDGEFKIFIGGSSDRVQEAGFRLVK